MTLTIGKESQISEIFDELVGTIEAIETLLPLAVVGRFTDVAACNSGDTLLIIIKSKKNLFYKDQVTMIY